MSFLINNHLLYFSCLLLTIVFLFPVNHVSADELTLAIANSTCKTVKKIGKLYSQQNDVKIKYICKSSGRLAKGLSGGAIFADIYLSANQKWMDYMLKNELVSKPDIVSPWSNKLVVATNNKNNLEINQLSDLAKDKIITILIGDPGTAPFGRYAKELLKNAKLWKKIKNKIVTKKHITLLADTLAISDNSTIGILFYSNISKAHKVIHSIDQSMHSPIAYYLAPLIKSTNKKQAADFMIYLQNKQSQEIFQQDGFSIKAL